MAAVFSAMVGSDFGESLCAVFCASKREVNMNNATTAARTRFILRDPPLFVLDTKNERCKGNPEIIRWKKLAYFVAGLLRKWGRTARGRYSLGYRISGTRGGDAPRLVVELPHAE